MIFRFFVADIFYLFFNILGSLFQITKLSLRHFLLIRVIGRSIVRYEGETK